MPSNHNSQSKHFMLSFQLPVHPVDDEHVQYIESLAFRHFKQRDSYPSSPSAANGHIIAALYAEVIGVVAQARLQSVCKRFLAEFKEYQSNPAILINLIYGMKYLRIKVCTILYVQVCAVCSTAYFISTPYKILFFIVPYFSHVLSNPCKHYNTS